MRAVIRSVQSADVDVETFVPERPDDAGVWVRLLVGPADGPGEESFDVLVCTPLWLRRVVRNDGPQIGRHHLLMEPFDLRAALTFLRRRFESETATTWRELGERLGRIGYWEFEDYKQG